LVSARPDVNKLIKNNAIGAASIHKNQTAKPPKIAPKLSKDTIIIVNSCGDAKKDRDILRKKLGKKI